MLARAQMTPFPGIGEDTDSESITAKELVVAASCAELISRAKHRKTQHAAYLNQLTSYLLHTIQHTPSRPMDLLLLLN